jgi:hypothetical protein
VNAADKNIETSTRLQFLTGGRTIQHGSIKQGGKLIIDYDPWRLPNLRRPWRELPVVWNIEAFVHFHPGGQLYTESVLEGIHAQPGGPVIDHRPKTVELSSWTKLISYFPTADPQFLRGTV